MSSVLVGEVTIGVSALVASVEKWALFPLSACSLLLVLSELLSTQALGDVELLESIGVVEEEQELGVPRPSDVLLLQLLVAKDAAPPDESNDSCELPTLPPPALP